MEWRIQPPRTVKNIATVNEDLKKLMSKTKSDKGKSVISVDEPKCRLEEPRQLSDMELMLNFLREQRQKDNVETRIPPRHWRYVNTKDNPADVASRGMAPGELIDFLLWWNGPSWLLHPPDDWPIRADLTLFKELPETRKPVYIVMVVKDDIIQRYCSYNKLLRIVAWCRRFVFNCKNTQRNRSAESNLSLEEVESAERQLFKLSQLHYFQAEIRALGSTKDLPTATSIANQRPFLDDHGLLRVGGRLQQAEIDSINSHPLILHRKAHLSKLLVRQLHIDALHAGPTALMGLVKNAVGYERLQLGRLST